MNSHILFCAKVLPAFTDIFIICMGFCIRDIIYVNGSIRTDDSALGKLMSDFYCTKADGMYYKELSDKVRHYKESEEGVKAMCDIWEEVKNEGIQEGKIEGKLEASIENAKTMLKSGKLSLEEIAEFSGLSIEKVRELAGNKSA